MTTTLTVLHDPGCPLCARFRDWLVLQPTLVPLRLVAAGSPEARALYPTLDHDRTLREITVVGDGFRDASIHPRASSGVDAAPQPPSLTESAQARPPTTGAPVWTNEHAWVMCLWATRRFRAWGERLAHPAWLPLARGAAASAAGIRHLAGGGGYPDGCAGTCAPTYVQG